MLNATHLYNILYNYFLIIKLYSCLFKLKNVISNVLFVELIITLPEFFEKCFSLAARDSFDNRLNYFYFKIDTSKKTMNSIVNWKKKISNLSYWKG